jgi:hypothetical protein
VPTISSEPEPDPTCRTGYVEFDITGLASGTGNGQEQSRHRAPCRLSETHRGHQHIAEMAWRRQKGSHLRCVLRRLCRLARDVADFYVASSSREWGPS